MAEPGDLVYALYDERTEDLNHEIVTHVLIGVYTSSALAHEAMEAVEALAVKYGGAHAFSTYPVELDDTSWTEGYVTVV